MKSLPCTLIAIVCSAALCSALYAEDEPGLASLDKATELKLGINDITGYDAVVKQCEKAIQEGLSKENEKFANQLIAATLFERATRLGAPLMNAEKPNPRWPLIRRFSLNDLSRALKANPDFAEAHLLVARLESLPRGDRTNGLNAAGRAIELSADNKETLAKAYLARAALTTEVKDRLADLNKGVEANPADADILAARGRTYMMTGEEEKGIADLEKVADMDTDSVKPRQQLVEAYIRTGKLEEARKQLDKAMKAEPEDTTSLLLSAQLSVNEKKFDDAIKSLDKVLELDTASVPALMMRASVHMDMKNTSKALADVQRALVITPGLVKAVYLRALIYASQGKFDTAILEMKKIVESDANAPPFQIQLARLLHGSGRPRAAVAELDKVLSDDEANIEARRLRADALLSYGEQKKAVADYEYILKAEPNAKGTLNNLAWVLATSPDENIRNAKRAIEIAVKACEATDYKTPHVLSTLAAAHAEAGDFEKAKEWSQKAVDLAVDEDMKKQLQGELESYKQKKPWREKQETEEMPEVANPRGGSFLPTLR